VEFGCETSRFECEVEGHIELIGQGVEHHHCRPAETVALTQGVGAQLDIDRKV